MVFSSIPFLYYFLPITLILYFISPKKLKNTTLLLSSLFFYSWGEPKFVIFMIISVTQGYIFGILIEKFRKNKWSKIFLTTSVIFSLGLLGYFKYADFFISNFNAITGLSIPLLKVVLPIGISFYTFQILSYVIDVYRNTAKVQYNYINLASYIAMFPQLVAGPIVRYSDISVQLESRTHSFEKSALGIRRFIIGLAKKVLIANNLAELCSLFKNSEEKSVLFFWMYAIACMLNIYFDFSGYSDMAIGLGKIFGFDFIENFNYPYVSKSITEFWRRWHISLGSWFRDYVYIPLGGNRVAKWKWLLNILIVWALTGFWHGASWNFIIWGLYFSVLLIIEKLCLSDILKKSVVFCHIYVLFFVCVSFIIFDSTDMGESLLTLKAMFGIENFPVLSAESVYYLKNYAVLLTVSIIGATPLTASAVSRISSRNYGKKVINTLEPFTLALLLILSTAYLVDGSFNPFLYFRF